MSRVRNWCITIFNGDLHETADICAAHEPLRYYILQGERCPSTGREHLQCYLEFRTSVRMGAIKRLLGNSLHAEARRGTRDQARDYCRKEESRISGPIEGGTWEQRRGQRRDLEVVKEKLDEGVSISDIAGEHFGIWCRYRKSFDAYQLLRSAPRGEKTKLVILWGKAGTGKTRLVYDTHGKDVYDLPRPNGGSVWFDGLAHSVLLIDDFYGWVPLHLLLKLGDRYPLRVPVKGGMVNFNCTHLYITSNKHPDEWYHWSELGHNLREAFDRRIDEIKEFN